MVIPSEFSSFVRDTGIRAFNQLADQPDDFDTPLRAILRQWTKLTGKNKEILFDAAIAAAQSPAEPAPKPRPRAERPVKRFDPEEVAKTLPKKEKKKSKPAAAKTKKSPQAVK